MMVTKGLIVRWLEMALGRRARGWPDENLIDNVHVLCSACGGFTVFPVLKDGGVRPCPAACRHCGIDV